MVTSTNVWSTFSIFDTYNIYGILQNDKLQNSWSAGCRFHFRYRWCLAPVENHHWCICDYRWVVSAGVGECDWFSWDDGSLCLVLAAISQSGKMIFGANPGTNPDQFLLFLGNDLHLVNTNYHLFVSVVLDSLDQIYNISTSNANDKVLLSINTCISITCI